MATHEQHGHAPPPPPEPRTPMWLPALGAALFLAVGIWWLATPSEAAPPPPADSASDGGSDAPVGMGSGSPENAWFQVVRGA